MYVLLGLEQEVRNDGSGSRRLATSTSYQWMIMMVMMFDLADVRPDITD